MENTKLYVLKLEGDLVNGNPLDVEIKCVSHSQEKLEEMRDTLNEDLAQDYDEVGEIYVYSDMDFNTLEWVVREIEVV